MRGGGFLLKKRIAKDHKGKSGGLRAIVAYHQGNRLVFLFGFAKRDQGNIEDDEKKALHKLGDIYMSKSEAQINKLVQDRVLLEVHCNDEE
jgi:hypothetical protein